MTPQCFVVLNKNEIFELLFRFSKEISKRSPEKCSHLIKLHHVSCPRCSFYFAFQSVRSWSSCSFFFARAMTCLADDFCGCREHFRAWENDVGTWKNGLRHWKLFDHWWSLTYCIESTQELSNPNGRGLMGGWLRRKGTYLGSQGTTVGATRE